MLGSLNNALLEHLRDTRSRPNAQSGQTSKSTFLWLFLNLSVTIILFLSIIGVLCVLPLLKFLFVKAKLLFVGLFISAKSSLPTIVPLKDTLHLLIVELDLLKLFLFFKSAFAMIFLVAAESALLKSGLNRNPDSLVS